MVTQCADDEVDLVIEACERMSHHLTAAIVSNDVKFTNKVLVHTVNGTSCTGKRARTIGVLQNHWFGPRIWLNFGGNDILARIYNESPLLLQSLSTINCKSLLQLKTSFARGAGIGTEDSIKYVWSYHREIIQDNLILDNCAQPKATRGSTSIRINTRMNFALFESN